MKKSVAIAKEANSKKESSPTKSDSSIQRLRNEPERQLGSLREVIGNIRRDGGMPSVESIATELSVMPYSDRASALLALQQTHGNQYVQRVVTGIQAKLKIGQPNDIYEQEADRVADAVMRMPEPEVQRQVEEEKEKKEEELIQIKPISEQITPLVQRQVEEEVEEKKEEEILQTKEILGQTPEVSSDLESCIQSLKGGGQPLAESTRAFFEPRFGYDFNRVRLHTGAKADQLANQLGAKAFTFRRDIFFRESAYQPSTAPGRELLAHELVHVVQQRSSAPASIQRRPEEAETPVTFQAPQGTSPEPASSCRQLGDVRRFWNNQVHLRIIRAESAAKRAEGAALQTEGAANRAEGAALLTEGVATSTDWQTAHMNVRFAIQRTDRVRRCLSRYSVPLDLQISVVRVLESLRRAQPGIFARLRGQASFSGNDPCQMLMIANYGSQDVLSALGPSLHLF